MHNQRQRNSRKDTEKTPPFVADAKSEAEKQQKRHRENSAFRCGRTIRGRENSRKDTEKTAPFVADSPPRTRCAAGARRRRPRRRRPLRRAGCAGPRGARLAGRTRPPAAGPRTLYRGLRRRGEARHATIIIATNAVPPVPRRRPGRGSCRRPSRCSACAVGETVSLLHPPLPLAAVSMWTERGGHAK